MTRYAMGSYQRASGTRAAFAALSADLVAEGFPEITVNSGDRETAQQEAIFRSKFTPSSGPKDVGPYGDRRFWPGHGYWKRVVGGGTVGVPGTSNHEKRRAADLAPPYNAITTAHRRAQTLAKRHNITCEGLGFDEPWHWTFWGTLGTVGSPASTGGMASQSPATSLPRIEIDMKVIKVIQPSGTTWGLIGTRFFQRTNDANQAARWEKLWGTAVVVDNATFDEAINIGGLWPSFING